MKWFCAVCGYSYEGSKPPKECPVCSSTSSEFIKGERKRLSFDDQPFDVLVINGSAHQNHNTGLITNLVKKELRTKELSFKVLNLNELVINHCWCCYSIKDNACTYPCRNATDDARITHEMIIKSKAVIILSPVNWNNMSARLKDFLDRLTSIENQGLLNKPVLTAGKIAGIIVNGHEDGGMKTAMDILLYLEQLGYILAPFGITYRTHGATHNTRTDHEFFKKDKKIKESVKALINNIKIMLDQDIESRIKNQIRFNAE